MFHDYRTILFITENWENIKNQRTKIFKSPKYIPSTKDNCG